MVKVSVIIPVYNVENYIAKCLESLISQTLKDIEIICVNDGSKDSSLEILNQYAQKDKRIVVFNQKNQGPGVARNLGIEKANGEYIAFVDSDDWLDSNALEILYSKAKTFDCDIVEFGFKEIYQDSGRVKFHKMKIKLPESKIFNHNISASYLFGTILIACNKLFKASFIKNTGIKFAETRQAEDTIFTVSARVHAEKIIFVDKPFYNYLIRTGSAVNSQSNNNLDIIQSLECVKNLLIKEGLYQKYRTYFLKDAIKTLSTRYHAVPERYQSEYLELCKNLLEKDYAKLLKTIKNGGDNFWEKIFSVKNEYQYGSKAQKIITILGWKIRISKNKKN